jgi:hypothetical protein
MGEGTTVAVLNAEPRPEDAWWNGGIAPRIILGNRSQRRNVFPVRYGLYLCVPYGSHTKQRLFPQIALTG